MAESYGPALDVSPPASFTFSNSTGAVLECGVSGEPAPSVSWLAGDGTPLILQHDLMTALPNGSLHYKVKMIMMMIMMIPQLQDLLPGALEERRPRHSGEVPGQQRVRHRGLDTHPCHRRYSVFLIPYLIQHSAENYISSPGDFVIVF